MCHDTHEAFSAPSAWMKRGEREHRLIANAICQQSRQGGPGVTHWLGLVRWGHTHAWGWCC